VIGILDSGIGGTGIEQAVRRLLPGVETCYLRDTAHFPYGDKPSEEVVRIIDENCGRLVRQGAKLIVLACNSASVVSLAHLRAKYHVPFVGVVPAVKPAAALTKTGKIAVFGTALTSRSAALDELIAKFCDGITVYRIALEGLAEAVEFGEREEARWIVGEAWHRYRDCGLDVVVLGCTHYTLIRDDIQRIVGEGVKVIDSNEAVAKQVKRVWEGMGDRG
jgi:glutamate racemase